MTQPTQKERTVHTNFHDDMIRSFAGKTVFIIGDVILDEYLWGKVKRISPEAPVPVVEFESRTHRLGGAGNVAANVQSLGGMAVLASAVGADPEGEIFLDLLGASAMDRRGVLPVRDRRTTMKSRLMAHNQQIARVDYELPAPLSAAQEDELLSWAEVRIGSVDACVVSDYAKGLVSPRLAECFISLARTHGKPVVVDPKGTNFVKYRGAALVKPNLHEVEKFFHGELRDEEEVCDAGRRLLELLPGSSLLVTRGQLGMSLFRQGRPARHIPSIARHVYDVTGAGDTVTAVLALALAVDADLEEAAELANRAAGVVVGKLGTSQVTAGELLGGVADLGLHS
jgi:D-beta-D-heptose 7-phosphate kinase/D-beta-D-heptose 1-phosphate adenosyltransferase